MLLRPRRDLSQEYLRRAVEELHSASEALDRALRNENLFAADRKELHAVRTALGQAIAMAESRLA